MVLPESNIAKISYNQRHLNYEADKMGNPNDLFALQKLDTSLFELRAKLQETQLALQEPTELVSLRTEAETLNESLATTTAQVKDKELNIGTLQEKLSRSTERLYSGQVKNPKELEDLEAEVKSIGKRVEGLELELMEAVEKQETLKSDSSTSNELLAEMEADWKTQSQDLRISQGEIATEMKAILEKRKPKVEKIAPNVLNNYMKLLKSKSGLGIVKLKGSNCEGCKIGMDGGTVRQVNSGQLLSCPSCGRYLIRG